MAHNANGERARTGVRGRPFKAGNNKGKPTKPILDALDDKTDAKREIIDIDEQIRAKTHLNEDRELPQGWIESKKEKIEESDEKTIIDSLSFKDEKGNTVKIVFFSCKTRHYRIQIYLNEGLEIRPMTYSGCTAGTTFWQLLKNSLIK